MTLLCVSLQLKKSVIFLCENGPVCQEECSHSGIVASSMIEGLLHKQLFLDDCGIVL